MRWLYPDPNDHEEAAARRAIMSRIEKWWQAFTEAADKLPQMDDPDRAAFMKQELGAVDQRLTDWEIDTATKPHRLMLSPCSDPSLRVLIEQIVNAAPEVDGWEIYPGLLPREPEVALREVEFLASSDAHEVLFAARMNEMRRIDLLVRFSDFRDVDFARSQARRAVLQLLGDAVMQRWVGAVEVTTQRDEQRDWKPLAELSLAVAAKIAEVDSELPGVPLWQMTDKLRWSLWRLSPPDMPDYPRQQDLLMGNSALDAMSACAQLDAPFDSRRYSKAGETFLYLKFDGDGRKVAERMSERKRLEQAVNHALVHAKLGCVVGAGTGKRYSYLDIAVVEPAGALPVICELARAGGVSERSWVLFHDLHLRAEWRGVYPVTPPPP
jgi:hypothetical protein